VTEQTTEGRSSRAVVKTTVIQANNNDPVVKSVIFIVHRRQNRQLKDDTVEL